MGPHHAVPPDQRPHRRPVHRRQPDPAAHHHRAADRQAATRPLAYVRDGDRFVLCASNGGSPRHPGWYHNLCATGRAEVQVGPEQLAVSAKTADPAERSRLFPRFVQMYKGYADYEHKTSRQIPLVVLTPEHRLNMT
jgi:deazaflavin-dependent oxidoreductase (nitroreductase family)